MLHKITSNTSVMYDAQNQLSSVLTGVPRSVNMEDRNGMLAYEGSGMPSGSVIINMAIYADFGTENQTPVNGYSNNVDDITWDTFYASQTLQSTELFDQVMETACLYTIDNIPVMYGLSGSDWTYSQS